MPRFLGGLCVRGHDRLAGIWKCRVAVVPGRKRKKISSDGWELKQERKLKWKICGKKGTGKAQDT